jgi:hypothetical protein
MKNFLFSITILINLLLGVSVSAHNTPCAHTHGVAFRNLPNTCNVQAPQEVALPGQFVRSWAWG